MDEADRDEDEEESEEGVLDLIVTGTDAVESLLETMHRIVAHHTQLSAEIAQIGATSSAANETPKRLKAIINAAAETLRVYAKKMASDLPNFKAQTDQVILTTARISEGHFEEGIIPRSSVESVPRLCSN